MQMTEKHQEVRVNLSCKARKSVIESGINCNNPLLAFSGTTPLLVKTPDTSSR